MIKRHPYLLCLVVAVASQVELRAQDFKSVLVNIRKQYSSATSLHIIMDIQAAEKSSEPPFYHEQVEIMKNGGSFRYKMSEREVFLNDRLLVMVDLPGKEIHCTLDKRVNTERSSPVSALNLDSVLNITGTPQLVEQGMGIAHYSLRQKAGEIDRTDFYLRESTNMLTKIKYHYRSGQEVYIKFVTMDLDPKWDAGLFDDAIYVKSVKGKWMPSDQFRDFSLSVNGQ